MVRTPMWCFSDAMIREWRRERYDLPACLECSSGGAHDDVWVRRLSCRAVFRSGFRADDSYRLVSCLTDAQAVIVHDVFQGH